MVLANQILLRGLLARKPKNMGLGQPPTVEASFILMIDEHNAQRSFQNPLNGMTKDEMFRTMVLFSLEIIMTHCYKFWNDFAERFMRNAQAENSSICVFVF